MFLIFTLTESEWNTKVQNDFHRLRTNQRPFIDKTTAKVLEDYREHRQICLDREEQLLNRMFPSLKEAKNDFRNHNNSTIDYPTTSVLQESSIRDKSDLNRFKNSAHHRNLTNAGL